MTRVFALGKVHRALAEFADDKGPPDPTTKKLLKGFYTQDRWELENDSEQESSKFASAVDYGHIKGLLQSVKGYAGERKSQKQRDFKKKSQVLPDLKQKELVERNEMAQFGD